jgi:hypothetical protein
MAGSRAIEDRQALQIIHRDFPSRSSLLAHLASNTVGPDSPAWAILQDRLGSDSVLGDPPSEGAVHFAPVLMMPSHDILLFATQPPPSQGPGSFLGSVLVHALAAAVLWFSIGYKPPVARITQEHYPVRQIDLRTPSQQAASHIPYPNLHPGAAAPAGHTRQSLSLPRTLTPHALGPQTLIQADIPKPITLPQQIPVPQVVLWSPSDTTAKHIVPPLPEQPTAADVVPVLDRPNQELNLADVDIASSNQPSLKSLIAPSTTSPVTIHAPAQVQLPPASASQQSATPTPAAVLSLSDIRLKDGSAALPPVNESQASKSQDALAAGQAQNPSAQAGKGAPAAKPGDNGAGVNPETSANPPEPSPAASKPETASPAPAAGIDTNALGQPASTPIALPKDGHFGAVIVGDALEQEFPEITGAWSGRMAYTAYLHVGLSRSWIMQYSLSRDAEAAAGGTVSRLEAPWPYNIVRPNLAPGSIDADALMIRGFVNESGRFEDLSVVFPQSFSGAQFVLTALQKWEFRPATQNGQPAKVEILLIIPEELQ